METQTTENNKLIADFIGMKARQRGAGTALMYDNPTNSFKEVHPSCLEFDSSWNWLMPAVEKIESLGFIVSIFFKATTIRNDSNLNLICEIKEDNKIQAVYKAVIEFIKWYNENKNK